MLLNGKYSFSRTFNKPKASSENVKAAKYSLWLLSITLRSLYCCSSKTGKLQAKASSEKYCKAAKNKQDGNYNCVTQPA